MLPAARYPRHACPLQASQDALLLLASGRVDMAHSVLEPLPDLIRQALAAAAEQARGAVNAEVMRLRAEARELDTRLARLRRELADVEAVLARRRRDLERQPTVTRTPRRPKPHEVLARALASGAVTPERVAEVLRTTPRHVHEIAGGRVGLAPSGWRQALAALGLEPDRP